MRSETRSAGEPDKIQSPDRAAMQLLRLVAPVAGAVIAVAAGFIAGVCIESRLPLATLNVKRYAGIKDLKTIFAEKLL